MAVEAPSNKNQEEVILVRFMDKPKPEGKEKVIFSGSTFEIVEQPTRIGDVIKNFEFARRSPGVRLLIIDGRKILLTREFRSELNDYDYRLPGGKVFNSMKEYRSALDKGEDILEHAKRAAKAECLEETGIAAKSIKHFLTSNAGATVTWDLFYFIVDDFEESKQKLDLGEVIYPEWKTFEEAKEMCLNGEVKEDRSVGVLLRFLLSR
jgi:ADP-ribose pyrophosphatase